MESYKDHKRKINVTSFIIALIIGGFLGVFLGNWGDISDEPLTPIPVETIPVIPDSTFSSGLLIGVDDINLNSPRLESAWSISFDQENQQFQLLPLYPILPLNTPENLLKFLSPHDPVIFPSLEIDNIAANDMFSSFGFKWDFTLIMDKGGLDNMLESFAASSSETSRLKLEYLYSLDPTLPGSDPTSALSYQRTLYEILCEDPTPLLSDSWINDLIDMSAHFHTDLNLTDIIQIRETIQKSDLIPSCQFSWQ